MTASFRILVVRTSLIALSALALFSATSRVAVAQVDIAPIPLLAPPGLTFTIPEPVLAPAPELLQVSIPGGLFGAPGEVDLFDPLVTGGQLISDRILFDNSINNSATITFLSDDEQNNLFPGFPSYPIITTGFESATITIPLLVLPGGPVLPLTVTMLSDSEVTPAVAANFSDQLSLKTPEPSTICLGGFGLAALFAMAFRRARRARA